MEAILACHPAFSTDWLAGWQCHVKYNVCAHGLLKNRQNDVCTKVRWVSNTIRDYHMYSQACELRPPKGVVLFLRWSHLPGLVQAISNNGVVHMPLCEPPASAISSSSPRVRSGVFGNELSKRSLQTRWSLVRSACEELDNLKSDFRSIWRMWSLFAGWIDALGRPPVTTTRMSEGSHLQECTPHIWIGELNGLKLLVRNFQVVAFVKSQGQVWLYAILLQNVINLHCAMSDSLVPRVHSQIVQMFLL